MTKQKGITSERCTDYYSDCSNFDCDFLFIDTDVQNINYNCSLSNVLNSLSNMNLDEAAYSDAEYANGLHSESIGDIPVSLPNIANEQIPTYSLLGDEELEISEAQADQDSLRQNDWQEIINVQQWQSHYNESGTISKYCENSFDNVNRLDYSDVQVHDSYMIGDNNHEHDLNDCLSKDDEIKPVFLYPTLFDEVPADNQVHYNNKKLPFELKRRYLHPRKGKPVRPCDDKITTTAKDCTLLSNEARKKAKSVERFGKRNGYYMASVETKKKAIELAKKVGGKKAAQELNLSEKSIKLWVKIGPVRRKGGGRKTKDPKMEQMLIKWYHDQKNKGKHISIDMIKTKAVELSTVPSFIGSKGWFDKFRNRYNICVSNRHK